MHDLTSQSSLRGAFFGFVSEGGGIPLSELQIQAAGITLENVCRGLGGAFTFDYLSEEDAVELHIQLMCYLLRMRNHVSETILSIHPDEEGQVQSMDKLVERLWRNIFTRGRWQRQGDDFAIGRCRVRFRLVDDGLLLEKQPANLVIISKARKMDQVAFETQFSHLTSSLITTYVQLGSDTNLKVNTEMKPHQKNKQESTASLYQLQVKKSQRDHPRAHPGTG